MDQYLPYLQWIDHQRKTMKDLCIAWGNINSHTLNIEGLEAQMKALKTSFQALDAEMKEIDLKPYTVVNEHGLSTHRSLGKALHIRKRPDAPVQILFAGHMDTVYPKHSTFQKVVDQDDVRLHGPGVCDMKGGLVVLLMALQAVEKSPYAQNIGWEIIINPDEEIGSPGSREIFKEAAPRHHLGLLFEPSHSDGSIVSSRAGSMKLSVVVKGKSAHAGRDFAKGRSSLFAVAPLIVDLEALNTLQPNGDEVQNFDDQVIVNCGELHAGSGFNVVPDLAILRINVRASKPEVMAATKAKITELVQKHSARDGIWMELHDDGASPPKVQDEGTNQIIEWLKAASADLGTNITLKPSRGSCDGNFLAAAGLSCIDTLGVIGGNIHTHDEFLLIDSLPQRAKLTALLLMRLGSGDYSVETTKKAIRL
ncbi:MAG: hydrolase [Chlamydiales bacterium]|nr:hydrolase [Chlamydiales bacterium]